MYYMQKQGSSLGEPCFDGILELTYCFSILIGNTMSIIKMLFSV